MDKNEFDEFVLTRMPTFIAINYQRLLETQNPQEQVKLILHIYNFGLRALTINLVSQYVFRDRDRVRDPYLENLLEQRFPHLTTKAWEDMLFTALRAYQGHRTLFFMPELYDFYWDSSTHPHRRRADVKRPFDRLTQATQDLQTERLLPQEKAGWQALASELLERLHEILQSLSFIGTYDLIHVLAQDEQTYTFELHKGTQVVTDQRLLPQHAQLTSDWFYLRAGTEELLPLHPLLIFWNDSIEPTDTGVFDRWIQERLKYLLATPGQVRFDEKRVRDFVKLIYLTIKEVVGEQAEKLTWVQLCDLCEKITAQHMATVQGKYHQQLYLQRDTARQHVEAFLADPKKRGFVLVGKSGVGKSNFLLALAEELHQSRNDVCVLMYDGANLRIASSVLTDIISQDFSDLVVLSGHPVHHIWQEIAKINGIDERQVILCVDAVNENLEAKQLLQQLDELIRGPWPWLKVVLSSRPETWKEIKRGVKLAEVHYYQEPSTASMGIELEPFSYSEQMEPFTPQELPKVYSNYQREFHLQTPYEALTHQLRETLRDPLNLWLLANTYKGQAIPDRVKTSKLIEYYLKTRQVQTPLQREDVRFLEDRLVPLMVREEHYSKVITEAELDAAGGALYDMVYSDQVLSDGRHMNQSFLRLCDVDILVLHEQGTEQRIGFKYERFYEYFAGKKILNLSETQSDRYAFFRALVEETTGKPFLWGAVRNALVEEAKKPDFEPVLQLCKTAELRVKEMMVSVLVTLGQDRDNLQQVNELLDRLLPASKQPSEWSKGRKLLGKGTTVLDAASRNAGKIAIEVASNLGIPQVLQRAGLQLDPTLRTEAVRYSYHLWQRDQVQGFEVLVYLAEQAVRGVLPNLAALESALGLSIVIFLDHYQDRSALRRLQNIWRGIIGKLLLIREEGGRRGEVMRAFLRERLLSFTLTIFFRILDNLPPYNPVSYKGLEQFFQLGPTEKSLYRNLVQYLDIQGRYSREQMEHDYFAAIKINNLLLNLITVTGLVAHAIYAPRAFLPFLNKLFEEAKNSVANPHLANVTKALECVLDRDPMIDEVFDFFVYTLEVSHQYYTEYPQALLTGFTKAPEAAYLGPYSLYQYQRTGTVKTEWLETRVQTALSQGNIPFFELLLMVELPHVGIELQKPLAALEALELFFKSGNEKIDGIIQSFLARLRVRYPDTVDDFLEEQQASQEFRLQVQTKEPIETIGELIGQNAWYFLRDEVILNSPELRAQLIEIFDKAADCKDIRAWLDYFIRQIVNRVYGGEALHQAKV